jgi:hypothetical protein
MLVSKHQTFLSHSTRRCLAVCSPTHCQTALATVWQCVAQQTARVTINNYFRFLMCLLHVVATVGHLEGGNWQRSTFIINAAQRVRIRSYNIVLSVKMFLNCIKCGLLQVFKFLCNFIVCLRWTSVSLLTSLVWGCYIPVLRIDV